MFKRLPFIIAGLVLALLSFGAYEGTASADHGSCAPNQTLPDLTGLTGAEAMIVMNIWNKAQAVEASSNLAKYTFDAGICSWAEMVERAEIVGKALAIYAALSEGAGITVNASPSPCASATTGKKVDGYTAGFVDAGGLFIGWPTWDANWFTDASGVPNKACPLAGRISDIKTAVEQTYFNVTGVRIDFDTFPIEYEPAWPDFMYAGGF